LPRVNEALNIYFALVSIEGISFFIFPYNPPQLKVIMNKDKLRNIAIIAHVDHGKTTLV